ncbi:MAG: hypothetical protein GX116_02460 [Fibrobacter sp.]|nr:hypothetical protein [Fibrobacter sp.]
MKHLKTLLFTLFLFTSVFSTQIQELRLNCTNALCKLSFQFDSDKNLPSFYQQYNASSKTLTVAFSQTDLKINALSLGSEYIDLNLSSSLLKKVRVFQEHKKQMKLLKFEFVTGDLIQDDKNKVELSTPTSFSIVLPKSTEKPWALSKLVKDKRSQQVAKENNQKDIQKDSKSTAEIPIEKSKTLNKEAQEKTENEKNKIQEKSNSKLTNNESAKDNKSSVASNDKASITSSSVPKSKDQEKSKEVSALIEGVQKMLVLSSFGLEQFQILTDESILLSNISPIKNKIITIGLAGPTKSPVFNLNYGSIVKSVYWGPYGLNLELHPNVEVSILVRKGVLTLQTNTAKKIEGIAYWEAKPTGIYERKWLSPNSKSLSFDSFTEKHEETEKKIISQAQTFYLRPMARELIVVSDEVEFYAKPSDKAQVLQRLVFGDRLVNLESSGLFQKVELENKVGYVYKRAVSYRDELSSIQLERLKQLAFEKGGDLDSINAQFRDFIEDRVSYSSFGRRDPFLEVKGLVEEGINIDQVELVGIIWEAEEPIAILAESKNPTVSYTVKEGDKILNGKVLKINPNDILFLIQEFGVSRRYSMALPDKYGSLK